jgi:hypothetical protein
MTIPLHGWSCAVLPCPTYLFVVLPCPSQLCVVLWQANRGSFPHTFFFETPAEHPKDNNGQTCAPMTGEPAPGGGGLGESCEGGEERGEAAEGGGESP